MIDPSSILDAAGDRSVMSEDAYYASLMRVMVISLQSASLTLPQVGQSALDLATQVWVHGTGDAEALTPARVSCIKYLAKKHGNSVDIIDSEDYALRALRCVLHPIPGDDPRDIAEWFAIMMSKLHDSDPQPG